MHYPPKLIYYFLLLNKNLALSSDRYKKFNAKRNDGLLQTIPCVELIEVDLASDCPCAPASGCTWMKSKHPIPELLSGSYEFVSTLTGKDTFDGVKWGAFDTKLQSRMPQQRAGLYYTTRKIGNNIHLYIYNNSKITQTGMLKSVTISGIFKDPMEVQCFPTCGKNTSEVECGLLDTEFVLPTELHGIIFDNTLRSLQQYQSNNQRLNPIEDQKNNDRSD